MKYTIVLIALIGITACTKKKDHRQLTVCGQIDGSLSRYPVRYTDSFCVTYLDSIFTSNGHIILATFSTDSTGLFCFRLDGSLAGQILTVFERDTAINPHNEISIPATATDTVRVGKVMLKL